MNLAELIRMSRKEKLVDAVMEYFHRQEPKADGRMVLALPDDFSIAVFRYPQTTRYHITILQYEGFILRRDYPVGLFGKEVHNYMEHSSTSMDHAYCSYSLPVGVLRKCLSAIYDHDRRLLHHIYDEVRT